MTSPAGPSYTGASDSHTHLVFAGERSAEFEARMSGTPYDGGGIAATVAATRAATVEELRSLLAGRMAELRAQGTTTAEVKSGYGLAVADEVRLLRLAASRPARRPTSVPTWCPPVSAGRSTCAW